MALQFVVSLSPNAQATKLDVVKEIVISDPSIGEVNVGFGDTVAAYRQVEIIEAINLLRHHHREDRKHDSVDSAWVAVVDMDHRTGSAVRSGGSTGSVLITANDLIVATGSGIFSLMGKGYLVQIDTAIEIGIQSMLEDLRSN